MENWSGMSSLSPRIEVSTVTMAREGWGEREKERKNTCTEGEEKRRKERGSEGNVWII